MATYVIAGPADSIDYAKLDRLADLLVARHSASVKIVKLRKHPSVWPEVRNNIKDVIGVGAVALDVRQPIVFTDTGRYIGDANIFSELCNSAYGVDLDVTGQTLQNIVLENMAEAEREARQLAVWRQMKGKKALIIIDVQNDFCPGGSLAVADGDATIPLINRLRHTCYWDLVVLTQDWHPPDHASFVTNNPGATVLTVKEIPGMGKQMMWPPHCVQGTPGADFHPDLERGAADIVIHKGTNSRVDSYSGFGDAQDQKFEKTELQKVLQEREITDVFVVGLALDYCVAYTCKDAARSGFNVFCVKDACRGIQATSIEEELAAMTKQKVHLLEHADDVPTRDIEDAAKRGIVGGAIAHVPPATVGGSPAAIAETLKF